MTQQRLSRTLFISLLSTRVMSKLRCSEVCCVASWKRCTTGHDVAMRQSNTHMAIVVTNTVYMDKRKNLEATMDRGLTVAWILAKGTSSMQLLPWRHGDVVCRR
ncbi:hypothetical protein HBI56_115650 [Parastagonospora nodorum]|nr:hypothetical protein HBH56_196510 [Parastagonospora nodorum]KAH3924803.1 hypothetical protein HBH54_186980 [Parastagonospora nodorum]KAH3952874.1 hypothetical protein HBH53_039120 [Parastagonospora nodorum]KAH3976193.1 hypothetical protein HBH52_119360 [Parastagonospora nodorum]KAH3984257.1 hypothetical protein HBH51_029280 [Parastagonospora nodorum]